MSLTAFPTPREELGAKLITAGYHPAGYVPPRPDDPQPNLGGCYPGWILGVMGAGWFRLFFRPDGNLTPEERYDIQRAQMAAYMLVFPAPEWETMLDRRRTGIPALLVRKAAPDG
jgi:hypothetical protein